MRKNEDDQTAKLFRSFSGILLGGVTALAVCLFVLLLCSVGISGGILNNQSVMQYTVAGCVAGGFFGGLFAVKRVCSKTLFIGLGASFVQFLLILTIGILIYPEISLSEHGLGIAAGCLAGGAIAGFLGGKPKKKRRK